MIRVLFQPNRLAEDSRNSRPLLFEKYIGGRFRGALSVNFGFEPGNLVFEQSDTLSEFTDREECQLLPKFVGYFLFRQFIGVYSGHGKLPCRQNPNAL
jgi:hypothetical protein